MAKTKLKKNDQIRIIAGKERGKQGKILQIDRSKGRVVIEGLNMVKKAVRPSRRNQKGGIIEVEAAIDLSNVMIICKKCGPTRIGFQGSGREKLRVCRKCGENL
jgi:large subunit ribosomal protein L24